MARGVGEPGCRAVSGEAAEWPSLQVRWMASGSLVCCVAATPKTRISEIKQLIQERVDISTEDMRLFLGSQELPGDATAPELGASALQLVRSVCDPCVTNLGHFRGPTEFKTLSHGEFTQIQKLASGIHGDIFKYQWRQEGVENCVAVKQLRNAALRHSEDCETDERAIHLEPWKKAPEAEDPLTEIGILSFLACQPDTPSSLLRLCGVFTAEDGFTWLVTEFADGGDLFDVAVAGCLSAETLQYYTFQLFLALAYLHLHSIAHRDISLENVLLKDGSIKLMDFGMSVRSHSASGTPLRFFRAVGKDSYRAPETYVPCMPKVRAVLPANRRPGATAMVETGRGHLCEVRFPADAVPRQACMAEVWGYAAQPTDLFSCGVCLFTLAWQCPPWKAARLSDPTFGFVHGRGAGGIEALLQHWKLPSLSQDAMGLLGQLLQPEPAVRPTAAACLESTWLAAAAKAPAKEGLASAC